MTWRPDLLKSSYHQRPFVVGDRKYKHSLPGNRPCLRAANHGSGKLELFDGTGQASDWSRRPAFESAVGGLASMADDYFAFCRMLFERRGRGRRRRAGVVAGVRRSVTRDQITIEQKQGAEIFFGTHSS